MDIGLHPKDLLWDLFRASLALAVFTSRRCFAAHTLCLFYPKNRKFRPRRLRLMHLRALIVLPWSIDLPAVRLRGANPTGAGPSSPPEKFGGTFSPSFVKFAPHAVRLLTFPFRTTKRVTDRSRIVASGLAFFSSTKLGGRTCLRVSVGGPATEARHIRELWDALGRTADAVAAEGF